MKVFLFAVLFMSSGLFACSKDLNKELEAGQVPAIVNNTLMARFPDAIDLHWVKKQNAYEADFRLAFTDYAALIDGTGKLVMYKKFVNGTDLPKSIAEVLQSDFATYRIEDLEKVNKAGQVFYQVQLEKESQEVKQVFSAEGQPNNKVTYWD
ncbi:hypothetical protein HUW51_22725 [Adhaeribacter swui]|uniref:PepSY-like domain-containing protein n=1 Tax=Adhaeribacter swui TaxID=2086471 RepID=A0A7G7GE07_9BACT|nr:hypothetical protein [Adhaeribacter swui]QNF35391.1 hypothetical protein HUW51_22725 [Adhaeribacter swui]